MIFIPRNLTFRTVVNIYKFDFEIVCYYKVNLCNKWGRTCTIPYLYIWILEKFSYSIWSTL